MAVFNEVRDLPVGSERDACFDGVDSVIVVEVRKMLARHEEHKHGSRFLDRPVLGTEFEIDREQLDVIRDGIEHDESDMEGQRIGRYEVVRVLGSGGMGIVYEAQQDHPRRHVALKMMRRSVGGEALRAASRRFRHEIEVLGLLQHPNIAQVYEAGVHYEDSIRESDEGVPYFVMELVDQAQTICKYSVEKKLDIQRRLTLFALVCDGVQHGHRNGIIHRDLKPGNILVGTDGQPKVIDFGVAKALTGQLNVTTLQTDAGRLIGTVQYMAPEQCDVSGGEVARVVDTRSDVYSLGVILYRLLCDRLPYDTADSSLVTAARTVCEAEVEPLGRVDRGLRGDLEAIVLKALARDPEKRYQSVGGLAEDIRRYLGGERIEARVATWVDRLFDGVRRHPVVTTAVICVVLAVGIVGGTAVGTWYLRQRPAYVMLDDGTGTAQLFSITGDIINTWEDVKTVEHVKQPNKLGWKQTIVIGFKSDADGVHAGRVCLYDGLHHETESVVISAPRRHENWKQMWPDRWIWQMRKVSPEADVFCPGWTEIADVFPDVPGDEMIVAWVHMPFFPLVLSIYNDGGELLYQRWHKGHHSDLAWDDERKQILFVGTRCDWIQDEPEYSGFSQEKKYSVHVLFALKPDLGHEHDSFIWTRDGGCGEGVVWYRCIVPALTWEVFGKYVFNRHMDVNGNRIWRVQLLHEESGRSINIPFDAVTGDCDPAQPSNGYAEQLGLPKAEFVGLCGYLPPAEALERGVEW